jgi:2-oxoglutarate dehydrogenase E2 component (dihydrolipoamide succinyltransferase)
MSIQVKIPALGESISEVVISKWLKKEGDLVKMDEVLCELETDKATMELNAEQAGRLHIVAPEGSTLPIGGIACEISEASGAQESAAVSGAAGGAAGGAVPDSAADSAAGSTGDSAGGSAASSAAGTGSQGTGDGLQPAAVQAETRGGFPSPSAAKIMAENSINPEQVVGTGRDGRIIKADALQAVATGAASTADPARASAESTKTADSASASPPTAASPLFNRDTRSEKMSQLRKTVARRLVAVKNETAMLTTFNEVDMSAVSELRGRYKDKFKEKYQVGLGYMSFFARAVCLALQEFPAVNARIEGDEMIFHPYVDLSVAVSAPKGLMVPVIRNAESLSLDQIEKEVARLAGRARNGQLSLEEMNGGTFTITNGGVFGSMLSTPIINAPQSAILGMHNIVDRPVAIKGEVKVHPVMFVALSYDHRIIDGKDSVGFLYRVKEYIEDPGRMLLGI